MDSDLSLDQCTSPRQGRSHGRTNMDMHSWSQPVRQIVEIYDGPFNFWCVLPQLYCVRAWNIPSIYLPYPPVEEMNAIHALHVASNELFYFWQICFLYRSTLFEVLHVCCVLEIYETLLVKVEAIFVVPRVFDVDLHILVDKIGSPLVFHVRRYIDENLEWLLDLV
jgi:hypothetical protein